MTKTVITKVTPLSLPKRTETYEVLKPLRDSFIQFFSFLQPGDLAHIIWEYWNERILSEQEYTDLITGLGSNLDEKCLKPLDRIEIFSLENIELMISTLNYSLLRDKLIQNKLITHFIIVKAYLITLWPILDRPVEQGMTSCLLREVLHKSPRNLELIKIDMDYDKDLVSPYMVKNLLKSFQNQMSLKKILLKYTNIQGGTTKDVGSSCENTFLSIFGKKNPKFTKKELKKTDELSTHYELLVGETSLGSFFYTCAEPDSVSFSML